MMTNNVSDAVLHSTEFMGRLLIPDLPDEMMLRPVESSQPERTSPAQQETLLIVPATADRVPLELHIDNCHRRCVALYDTQQILQFGGSFK
jgi:hypothetical protein